MSESVGRFTASGLRAKGGEISCWIFENSTVGLERSLFWSLILEFEPVSEEDGTSMTCDWIPWKFRHWKEMDGVILTAKYGEDGIEGSFYVYEHYPMENVTLAIRHIRDNLFELEMEMTVNYNNSEYSASESHLVVKGCAIVPFAGLYLGEGISFDEAVEFIELSAFERETSKNEFGRDYYKPKII